MSRSREKMSDLLNRNNAQLRKLGGPIDPRELLKEKPSEDVLTRAMLELFISRLNAKLYGG